MPSSIPGGLGADCLDRRRRARLPRCRDCDATPDRTRRHLPVHRHRGIDASRAVGRSGCLGASRCRSRPPASGGQQQTYPSLWRRAEAGDRWLWARNRCPHTPLPLRQSRGWSGGGWSGGGSRDATEGPGGRASRGCAGQEPAKRSAGVLPTCVVLHGSNPREPHTNLTRSAAVRDLGPKILRSPQRLAKARDALVNPNMTRHLRAPINNALQAERLVGGLSPWRLDMSIGSFGMGVPRHD